MQSKRKLHVSLLVQSALASQRMEGLEPEAQLLEDAQKWTRGEKTIGQAIAAFKARLQRAGD